MPLSPQVLQHSTSEDQNSHDFLVVMKMHWTVENETLHYLKYLTRQGEPPSIPLLYALDVLAVDGGNSQIVEREVGIETRRY